MELFRTEVFSLKLFWAHQVFQLYRTAWNEHGEQITAQTRRVHSVEYDLCQAGKLMVFNDNFKWKGQQMSLQEHTQGSRTVFPYKQHLGLQSGSEKPVEDIMVSFWWAVDEWRERHRGVEGGRGEMQQEKGRGNNSDGSESSDAGVGGWLWAGHLHVGCRVLAVKKFYSFLL